MTRLLSLRGFGLSVVLPLLAAAVAPAVETAVPRLLFEAPPPLERVSGQLTTYDRERLRQIVRLVGANRPGAPIRVLLAEEGSSLARVVPTWIAGFAASADHAVVLFPQRTVRYPDSDLEDLLFHEIAHVLIDRAAGEGSVPRWFHEGVAMIAGGSWGLRDRSQLALALVRPGRDRELRLSALDPAFSGRRGEAERAYALAGAFVRDLLGRHGAESVATILARVAAGRPFKAAVRDATGIRLATLEADFWRRQTFWSRWVPLLSSSATLWLLLTGLALWAARRKRQRAAALAQRWEEEDRWRADRQRPDSGGAPSPPPRAPRRRRGGGSAKSPSPPAPSYDGESPDPEEEPDAT